MAFFSFENWENSYLYLDVQIMGWCNLSYTDRKHRNLPCLQTQGRGFYIVILENVEIQMVEDYLDEYSRFKFITLVLENT